MDQVDSFYCICGADARYARPTRIATGTSFLDIIDPVCDHCGLGQFRFSIAKATSSQIHMIKERLARKREKALGELEGGVIVSSECRDGLPYSILLLIFGYVGSWKMRLVSRRWYDAFMNYGVRIRVDIRWIMMNAVIQLGQLTYAQSVQLEKDYHSGVRKERIISLPNTKHAPFWKKVIECSDGSYKPCAQLVMLCRDRDLLYHYARVTVDRDYRLQLLWSLECIRGELKQLDLTF